MKNSPDFWYETSTKARLIAWGLWPVSLLYALAVTLRQKFIQPKKLTVPVICIGNILVGGAGKTPTTLWLAEKLKEKGHSPHILLRGYGGSEKQVHQVSTGDPVTRVGDEALLYAQKFSTWISPDRYASGTQAIKAGANILLMDDGLQNPKLYKDLSILVIDRKRGLGNGFMLPAGPLREHGSNAVNRAEILIEMLPSSSISEDPDESSQHKPVPDFKGLELTASIEPKPQSLNKFRDKKLVAFAGIGDPSKFFDTLRQANLALVADRSFPDHHFFTRSDEQELERLAQALEANLVTTEKDWVRLSPQFQTRCSSLSVDFQCRDSDFLLSKVTEMFNLERENS